MSPDSTQRKLAAILSADVVGYSRLMADNEAATVKTLKAHKDLMGGLIRQHAGRVVDAVGDDLLAEFASVVDAVACSVAIQSELAKRNEELAPNRKMLFRIGVNLGDVIVEEDRIYGDGVNIAARVQAVADEGGVAISGTAFDHVEGKLGLEFEDLGQQEVKNIARPVRVYRAQVTEAHKETTAQTVPGFAGRPAIAVLPFDNLSTDPEQEYFADGIAEDLITRLSGWRFVPVIARNSSFVYKGRKVAAKEVGQKLGVRYIVSGSVRKADGRVRISAQLIDATTGHHVWAKRYDRELRDIFALQDEITDTIVASMHPGLLQFDRERVERRNPRNLDAWEIAQRGWSHFGQVTRDGMAEARVLFEKAIELDQHLVWALFGLALAHYNELLYGWSDSPARSVAELVRAAQATVAADEKDPVAHLALGMAYGLTGQRDKNISAARLAVQLNPSFALAYYVLGFYLALAGRPDEAIPNFERAMRLSPQDPWMREFLFGMALAHFAAGRYEDVLDWAQRSLQRRPDWPIPYNLLAASYAHLGRVDEARTVLKKGVRSLAGIRRALSSASPAFVERAIDGLRKAGLKE